MVTKTLNRERVASHLFSVVLAIAVVSLALYVTTGRVLADVPEDLEKAKIHLYENRFAQAQEVYKNIVRQHPGTKHALMAQSGFVSLNILSGQSQEAEIALEQLLQNFQQHKGIAQAVLEAIEEYLEARPPQYQKVLELSKWVLANGPDRKDAIWAQTNIVIANIKLGNESAVEPAYQTLVNQFGSHKDMPKAVCYVAEHLRNIDATKSLELYENALSSWPDCVDSVTDDSVVHWANIAILRLRFGDDAGSQVAFEKIINNSSKPEESEFGVLISEVTKAYLNLGKAQKALELLQYAQEHLSGTEYEIWIKAGMVQSHISLGDDPDDQHLKELLTDFAKHPRSPEAILGVGAQYYNEALTSTGENVGFTEQSNAAHNYCQKAMDIAKLVADKIPNYKPNSDTYLWLANSYLMTCRYEQAIESYKKLQSTYPYSNLAPEALIMIGQTYQHMAEAKVLSTSESDLLTTIFYEQLLEQYPDYPEASYAQRWVERYHSEKEGEAK
jgi:tetratricopeptide (TPR) repeat protein